MYSPIFTITNTILKQIGAIEAAKEIIEHAPLLPHFEKEFQKDAILRTTHYGTHIEGNDLSLKQVEQVLEGETVIARDRDIQEVINYRKVIDFIDTASNREIDEQLVFDLHKIVVDKILPEKDQGVYRQKEVVIKNSITGDISFRPPKALEVPWQMKELISFLNTDRESHAVIKAGVTHYEFVRIHPFLDGNGRAGRALSTLVLFKEGYDIRHFFSLEEHFDSDPTDYYDALKSVEQKNGDLTNWLVYFTRCVAQELSKIKEKIESISIDSTLRKKIGGPVHLSDRQIKIIEYIQKIGYYENKLFKTMFPMVSEDTVLREVQDLIKKKIIKKQGKTKGVTYVMND